MIKSNNLNDVRPFYISLRYIDDHDYHYIIHNCILNYGYQYNIIPKSMEYSLALKYTGYRPPIYVMDSRLIKHVGEIKRLSSYLDQFTNKYLVIDVVVVDVEPYFSIILSRHFGNQLEGIIKLYWLLAKIPLPQGKTEWLLWEPFNKLVVEV